MEEEIRIEFKALFRIIWQEKWWIVLITLFVTGLGIAYVLLAQKEFETQGKILPEIQGKTAGNLSQFAGLASLAGIDLNSLGSTGVDAVRPDLYPDVINSTPFYLELFTAEVHTIENKKMKFEDFYHTVIERNKKPNEKLLFRYPVNEEGILVVNQLNEIRLKDLRKRITAGIDKKSGVITIFAMMPDPVVAAEVTKFAMEYLMTYVKAYRTEKLRQDVDYLRQQVDVSRGKFYITQEKKARYSDTFQEMRLQSADVQRERIESEYRLSSSFYNELLKKYEEAKFKLHQETPVFQILDPPVTPVKKVKPKGMVTTIFSIFIGGILSLGLIMFKKGNYKAVLIKANI